MFKGVAIEYIYIYILLKKSKSLKQSLSYLVRLGASEAIPSL